MKRILTTFLSFLMVIALSAQGTESFTNLTASGSSYGSGSYTGDNGDTWTFNGARRATSTYNITGTSIGFGSSGTGNVSSNSGADGVGEVTFSIRSYFTGGNASDRTIEVFVNGSSQGSFTLAAMGAVETHTILNINEIGDVVIQFVSTGSRQIILDDVSWTAAPGPTPVTLRSFTASPIDGTVALKWETSSEQNNDYFSIEHSSDGRNYQEIGQESGAGTTTVEQRYSFVHKAAVNGLNYYRLKQMDFDGASEYSSVQVVEIKKQGNIRVFPSHAIENITIDLAKTSNTVSSLTVFDVMGRVIQTVQSTSTQIQSELNISNLSKGHYFIQVQMENDRYTKRFIKVN